MQNKLKAFERLLIIMDELRAQCPWDKKQTIESLRHLTIEETYELADAILDENMQDIKEEIGDVMCMIELIKSNGLITQREIDNQIQIKRMKLMKWSKLL